MRLHTVGLVFRKELLETLRDRRTLIVMIVLPLVLYPILGIGVTQWLGVHRLDQAEQRSRVGILGPSWPALEEELEAHGRIQVVPVVEEAQVQSGEVDLVVLLRPDLTEAVHPESEGTSELQLVYDETRDRSIQARSRVQRGLERFAERLRAERIARRGLPPSLVRPIALTEKSLASSKEVGARLLSRFLPILVMLVVLLGAFYPAIDLTAGEKERGTLETLLVSPVPRSELIAGKYLVVATIATLTGWLNLGSIGITFGLGVFPSLSAAGFAPKIPWVAVALTGASVVPAALFFAALMLAVAALARSFKEAQNLLTPVYMVCLLPAMAGQLPGIELTPFTALVPIANLSLLIRELIAGRIALLPAVIAVSSMALCTVVALRLAARVFESERMLFAPDPTLERSERRAAGRVRHPNGLQAGVLLLVVMALILLVGQRLQARDLISGILVTEWALIGLPVLLLIRFGKLDLRATLLLARSRPLALVGAALAGISAWYIVGTLVETLQQQVLPMPPEMIKAFYNAVVAPKRHLALDLFALALSPAICEEALFRGVLLQSMRRTMSIRSAVLINGLLFGLFHLSPWRFFPTMILGMLLALIVIRSGSIWPGVLFHFLNNATALVAGRLVGEPTGESTVDLPLFAASVVLFVGGLWVSARGSREPRAGPSTPPDRSG